jgi:hypothetical protein
LNFEFPSATHGLHLNFEGVRVLTEHKHPEAASGDDRRQYVNFGFYKVDPAWRRLPADDRKRGKGQFIDVVKSYDKDVMTIAYSMIGVRGDCDFMLWRIGFDLLKFQEMMAKLLETGLGNYLTTPYSFLSMTKRSVYVDKHTHTGQEGTRLKLIPGQFRYLFVYPFVKSKAWYRLTRNSWWPSRAISPSTSSTWSWNCAIARPPATPFATPPRSPASTASWMKCWTCWEGEERDKGYGTRDTGFGVRDSGLGIRDSGLGIRG